MVLKFKAEKRKIIWITIFLNIRYHKCYITLEFIYVKELILLKLMQVKSALFVTIIFFNPGFNFQDFLRNGCQDMTNFRLHMSDIAITTVKNVDYHCIIYNIRKSNPTNLLENYVFGDCGYIQKNTVTNFSLLKAGVFLRFC